MLSAISQTWMRQYAPRVSFVQKVQIGSQTWSECREECRTQKRWIQLTFRPVENNLVGVRAAKPHLQEVRLFPHNFAVKNFLYWADSFFE